MMTAINVNLLRLILVIVFVALLAVGILYALREFLTPAIR
jgi:xanthosine utilization system XapX-like protein